MHWLYLIVGIVSLCIASLKVTPSWAVVVLLLAALGFILAWMFGWMASRVGASSRDDMQLLSPEELRLLREQAEARKAAAAAPPPVAPGAEDRAE